ncbi:hypothetical protein F2P81_019056 [Scophthalmus maximus]|uniref:Uncharacterized protein n=1 Tax=Scophthalmus maximus TaxID=52904 RepID=A0A6A4SFK9_SCOMX|nr:hypothetical protein F2P81_019056 [Scophthalmus maximus]
MSRGTDSPIASAHELFADSSGGSSGRSSRWLFAPESPVGCYDRCEAAEFHRKTLTETCGGDGNRPLIGEAASTPYHRTRPGHRPQLLRHITTYNLVLNGSVVESSDCVQRLSKKVLFLHQTENDGAVWSNDGRDDTICSQPLLPFVRQLYDVV